MQQEPPWPGLRAGAISRLGLVVGSLPDNRYPHPYRPRCRTPSKPGWREAVYGYPGQVPPAPLEDPASKKRATPRWRETSASPT